jgi:hypothetical protein
MQMQLIDLLTLMITRILTLSLKKAFVCGGPNPGHLVPPGVGLTATFIQAHAGAIWHQSKGINR